MSFFPAVDPATLAYVALAFFIAGAIKGTLGMGLPLVAVPLLVMVLPPPLAIALMALPVLFSNGWMAFTSGMHNAIVRRFWTLMVPLIVLTFVGTRFLAAFEPEHIELVIGSAILFFCAVQVASVRARVSGRSERWLSPVVGAVAGLIGGLSSFFGVILVIYLVALRLQKDEFVATIGLLFLYGALSLNAGLAWNGLLGIQEAWGSAVACLPVLLGLRLGAMVRGYIPQQLFQRLLIFTLAVMGLSMIGKAAF